ncbi:hypothetical protein SNE40_003913 [Patella caerulea]|uniref:acid phosphatase n=1 Tax=Patella caerulea TaxID=87958 RepID=A0AAN8KCG8_PATCE
MYRHGDRSPVKIFKTDPNQADSWFQGEGYLTELGMNQHYILGQYLRDRYDGFLNKSYLLSEFSIRSSNIDRCLMSAYCNLAGLYPPTGRQVWNNTLLWQPIPVHTIPEPLDNMLAIDKPCPKYDQLYKKSLKSPEVVKEETDNKEFYKFLSEKSGVPHETIDKVWSIGDTLYCEKVHNKTWPSWVNDTIYNKLRDLETWGFDLLYKGPIESRLKGGPVLKDMIENMKQKIAGKSTKKMMVYVAHDTTITALLSAMGVFNQLAPQYTATVMMDLHQENNKYYVQVSYKNDTWPEPVNVMTLTLPGCEEKCPFNKFIELTKDKIPGDWDEECKLATVATTPAPTGPTSSSGIIKHDTVWMIMMLTLVAGM